MKEPPKSSSKAIAIIPARGGSKRIPRKNIKNFFGLPIINYPISAAKLSGCFQKIMCSTDDEEIAKIATESGAEVPFLRSAKNSSDHATTAEVLLEVIKKYSEMGRSFDYACCIYPTAALLTPAILQKAFDILSEKKSLSVLPVIKFGFPIQRAFKMSGEFISFMQPEHGLTRSQDLEPAFHDAGQFYFFDVRKFLAGGKLLDESSRGICISELEAQDVDNEDDWRMAELKWQFMKTRGK